MANFKVGQRVKIAESNDNENYKDFRDKILIVTHAEAGGLGYDKSMFPEKLMCFKLENEEVFPFSLYEYEIEPA
jgi:hypothetical protein